MSQQIKVSDINKLDIYQNKRKCYEEIRDFINSKKGTKGQICALYGLRRTGKTSLLAQVAKEVQNEGHKSLYLVCSDEFENIKIDRENNIKHIPEIKELFELLDNAVKEDYEYVFIDELTFIKDFVGQGNIISNYYANQGLNIIATGTDSLSFALVEKDDMMDRLRKIQTSYISFEEYNRLLDKSLDDYIRYGGTLKSESPYKDKSSTISYTNKAIVKNIIRSISNSEHNNPGAITLLYSKEDIVSAINRCINQMNQDFLISAINRNEGVFESHPFHLGLNNARNFPYAEYIDVLSVDEKVKESLYILDKNEMCCELSQEDINIIRDSLKDLDLVLTLPTYRAVSTLKEGERIENIKNDKDAQIISQAGMIYCHATELLKILTNDENWDKLKKCGIEKKDEFIRRIDRQVKGDILENLILYDTYNALKEKYYVSKLRLKADGKEVDVIVTDRKTYDTYLFEVKYADYIDKSQTKNLSSNDFMKYINDNFGNVKGRFVIYTGENSLTKDNNGEIYYISAEKYLKSIVHSKNIIELLERCQLNHTVTKSSEDRDSTDPAQENLSAVESDQIQKIGKIVNELKNKIGQTITEEKNIISKSFESLKRLSINIGRDR